MLFYGPSGAGKKTRISATLRQLYGPGTERIKIDQRVFLTPSKRKLDVNIVQSHYHIEITPRCVLPSVRAFYSSLFAWTLAMLGCMIALSFKRSLKRLLRHSRWTWMRSNVSKVCAILLFLAVNELTAWLAPSCYHQWSWFTIERRSSSTSPNDGEVYVKHACHLVREQHE